jgi:plasmid stabilization system protein ParE
MKIRWSLPAVEDLERICELIQLDNPEAGRRVVRTIYDGCSRLEEFPYLGRASTRIAGWRELVFSGLPYIAFYRIIEDTVEISRIFHAAQDWRPEND